MIKGIHEKPTPNIFNSERLNFSHKSGTKQECMLSPLLFNNVLEVLARVITQNIETKGNRTGKK